METQGLQKLTYTTLQGHFYDMENGRGELVLGKCALVFTAMKESIREMITSPFKSMKLFLMMFLSVRNCHYTSAGQTLVMEQYDFVFFYWT